MKEIYQLYLSLFKKYGTPKEFWAKWCKDKKTWQEREEIALSAILAQRTNWLNVERALENLKAAKSLSIKRVYRIGQKNIESLETFIRPSGFYKQKAKRVYQFCEFISKNYESLENFFKQNLRTCRKQLLEISGIGPETADTILLFAGDKSVFIIDEYTRRFAKKYNLSNRLSYDHLQDLFQKSLPQDIKVYQEFHAMIVLEGRGTSWDLVSKFRPKLSPFGKLRVKGI